MNTLYLVIPCYNEEEVLPETARRLLAILRRLRDAGKISAESRALFVDDGSRDRTWELIETLHAETGMVCGVRLSRNRGHQNALLAGLSAAAPLCDMAISLDADLQDDPEAIESFVDRFAEGFDVVYGVRSSRKTDTAFKRNSAGLFYKVMRAFGAEILDNHADYRLMSRRALEALFEFQEANLFLRGIVPLVGFSSTVVTYERSPRFAGESKYPLKKQLALALDGVTSFSVKPLRFIAALGLLLCVLAAAALVILLFTALWETDPAVWMGLSLWFLGGVQLFALGVVGEYIGKIYAETKRRPRFVVEKFLRS